MELPHDEELKLAVHISTFKLTFFSFNSEYHAEYCFSFFFNWIQELKPKLTSYRAEWMIMIVNRVLPEERIVTWLADYSCFYGNEGSCVLDGMLRPDWSKA